MFRSALPLLVSVMVCASLLDPIFCEEKIRLAGERATAGPVAAAPVPVSGRFWGLPLALSSMETEAILVPETVGVNVTLIAQLSPESILAPQVLIWLKSLGLAPVMLIPVMWSVAFPVLVRTTPCALLVEPTICEAKVRPDDGARVTTAPAPVPVSEAVCGLSDALSAKLSVAFLPEGEEGLNVTLTVQVLLCARVLPLHKSELTLNSVRFGPVIVTAPTAKVRSAAPLFVTVMVSGGLVEPTNTSPKYKLDGDKRTDAAGDAAMISYTAPTPFCPPKGVVP